MSTNTTPTAMTAVQAVSASSFTSAIGVNTHIDFNWSDYNNFAQVENALSYLGVSTIRDSIDNPMDPIKFTQLNADLGVKLDDFLSPGSVGFNWQVQEMEQAGSKLLVAVEGANESDNWPQTYNGLTGLPATEAEQAALYKDIKGTASTSGVTVIQSSFGQLGTFANVSGVAADADMGNAHIYFGTDNNPGWAGWIGTMDNYATELTPGKSVAVTETGYYTLNNGGAGVDDTTQAKYDLTDLFDEFKSGASIINLYELVDQQPEAGNTNPEYAFGLFNYDWTPKPAAIAVHNLMSILDTVSGGAPVSTPGSLTYSLSNMPTTGNSDLFQKSDGTFVLALWNDVRLQSATGGAVITVAPVNVTLSLGQAYAYVDVFDPLSGSSPIEVFKNASTIQISLPDHPVLIELSQTALPATATGPTIAAPSKLFTEVGTAVQVDGLSLSDPNAGSITVDVTASSGTLSVTQSSGTVEKGNSVSLTGTQAVLNAELATLTYTGAAAVGSGTVSVYAIDGAGLSSSQAIVANTEVTPTAPTDTGPVLTLPAAESVTTGAKIAVSGITLASAYEAYNQGSSLLKVSDTNGTLSMIDWSGNTISGSGTNSISCSEGWADLTAALSSLTYTAGKTAGTDTITITIYDQEGMNTTRTIAIKTTAAVATTTPVTSAPSAPAAPAPTAPVTAPAAPTPAVPGASGPDLTLPAAQHVAAGTKTAVTGVTLADVAAAANAGAMYLNVSDGSGTLSMTNAAGASVSGSGTSSITYSATFSNISAALASLAYTAAGTGGNDSIAVTIWDQFGRHVTESLAVAIAAAPAAPAPVTSATLTSASATVSGTSVLTTAIFANGTGTPGAAWKIAETAAGAVTITAPTAGYSGTATLNGIAKVTIASQTYALVETPAAGGALTVVTPASGLAGTIVAEGSGNDTVAFGGTGTSYFHTGNGTGTINLNSGFTNIYMGDVKSDYLVLNYGGGNLVLRDVANGAFGTKTINVGAGTGEVTFTDGSVIGLGNVGVAQQYGGTNTVWTISSGSVSDSGGSGLTTANFTSALDTTPDANWTIKQSSPGTITVTGDGAAGYTGTATLQSIGNVELGSKTYQLELDAYYSSNSTFYVGWQTNAGVTGTIFLDGTGNDTLSFGASLPSYWYAQGGTDTATLSAGTTEVILKGAASDYTESYDGTGTLTVTNTGNKDGTGTKILHLAGGKGELAFGDGTRIGLGGVTGDTTQYGGNASVLTGTAGSDTIYTGKGATIAGNGGSDTYLFGTGDGSVSISNGVSSANTAAGQVDFLGSLTDQNLWFVQSGNNLVVDVLGTKDQVTLKNFYAGGDAYAKVSEFEANNLKLDTQLATLVQAMATYSASHGGFNPQAAQMPTDATLQHAITAAWHK